MGRGGWVNVGRVVDGSYRIVRFTFEDMKKILVETYKGSNAFQ